MLLVCGLRDWPFDMKAERRAGPAPPPYGSVYPRIENILLATVHPGFASRIHTDFGVSHDYGIEAIITTGYPLPVSSRFGTTQNNS